MARLGRVLGLGTHARRHAHMHCQPTPRTGCLERATTRVQLSILGKDGAEERQKQMTLKRGFLLWRLRVRLAHELGVDDADRARLSRKTKDEDWSEVDYEAGGEGLHSTDHAQSRAGVSGRRGCLRQHVAGAGCSPQLCPECNLARETAGYDR